MNRTPLIALAALAFGSLLAGSPVAAQTKWNMPTPYADANFHTQNIKQFAEEIKTASGGKLEITVHSAASLYKLPEIKRAVQTGQVQIGEILVSSLANDDPMYEASSVPSLANNFAQARTLYITTRPFIETRLAKDGLKLLYAAPWPTVGVFLRAKADIKGQKIRTFDRTTSRFVELMGGIPVTVQAAEIPQSLATGIISGMVTSTTTAHDTKAWDYVKAYYDVRISFPLNMVFVNDRAFKSLDSPTQMAVLDAATKAEARGWTRAETLQGEMDAKVAQNGIEIIAPTDAMRAELTKVGKTMAAEWAARAGTEGRELLKKLGN